MKYTITLYNNWEHPYFYTDKSDKICTNVESSSYTTDDLDLAKTIIRDFLDVPETELTLDEIRMQFEDPSYCILTEQKLVSIQSYYNGRLAMYNTLLNDIEALHTNESKVLHYDIPYKYNHFTIEEEEPKNEKQIEAYIEVKVEND